MSSWIIPLRTLIFHGLFIEITYGADSDAMLMPDSEASPLGLKMPNVNAVRNSDEASDMSRKILSMPTFRVNSRGGWVKVESIIQTYSRPVLTLMCQNTQTPYQRYLQPFEIVPSRIDRRFLFDYIDFELYSGLDPQPVTVYAPAPIEVKFKG